MSQGTLIDTTLIAAPSSTKSKSHQRDPEMHQTKKGNEWHFGMKAHIGTDEQSGSVHTCRRRRQIDPYAGILLTQPKTLKSVAYARVTPI